MSADAPIFDPQQVGLMFVVHQPESGIFITPGPLRQNAMAQSTTQNGRIDNRPHEKVVLTGRPTSGISHLAGDAQAGLDLTTFGRASAFKAVLDSVAIPREPGMVYEEDERLRAYVWASESVLLVTGANPLTGERAGLNKPREPGYASYIGIEGTQARVTKVLNRIRHELAVNDDARAKEIDPDQRGFI